MLRNQVLTRSILASITLLNLSHIPQALAEPTWVQRGPHGAIHIVSSDRLSIGATALSQSMAHGFPKLVMKGSHGASHLLGSNPTTLPKISEVLPPAPSATLSFPNRASAKMSMNPSTGRLSAEELLNVTNSLI